MMVYGWHGDYPDADDWLLDLFGSAGHSNVFNYKSASFDAALRQAVTEPDPDQRAGLWTAAEHIMLTDAPIMPFYHPELVTLAQPWVLRLHDKTADEE